MKVINLVHGHTNQSMNNINENQWGQYGLELFTKCMNLLTFIITVCQYVPSVFNNNC